MTTIKHHASLWSQYLASEWILSLFAHTHIHSQTADEIDVAIKTCKQDASTEDKVKFLEEACEFVSEVCCGFLVQGVTKVWLLKVKIGGSKLGTRCSMGELWLVAGCTYHLLGTFSSIAGWLVIQQIHYYIAHNTCSAALLGADTQACWRYSSQHLLCSSVL